jgi:hypothetical protein
MRYIPAAICLVRYQISEALNQTAATTTTTKARYVLPHTLRERASW